jgi:hypothetical protein
MISGHEDLFRPLRLGREIDLWQKISVGARTMSRIQAVNAAANDDTRDPSDFITRAGPVSASVRGHGTSRCGGSTGTTRALDAVTEARFDAIEADLKKYRKDRFGDETETMDPQANGAFREQYDTIATWTDLMPTDGTHLEVVQASTMAADEMTLKDAEAASQLRHALIDSQKQDARLKAKAYDQITQPASLEVKITPYGAPTVDGGP